MKNRSGIGACFFLCLQGIVAQATTVDVGALSYDTFIPAGVGSPGVDAFDVANLTGSFTLPPDFPVTDSVTFLRAVLTLTLSNSSQQVFTVGDLGPGFLQDVSGNPVVQVPGDKLFASAEFAATISPANFTLFDGTPFQADSAFLDVFLLPSSGSVLTVDVDQTPLGVSGSAVTTPEPGTWSLALIGSLILSLRHKK